MKHLIFLLLFTLSTTAFGQYSGTPLMLSLPMDRDTIEEDEPVFVWQTTLSNLQSDPRLNVQLSVVKIGKDQTPAEAIIENAPVFLRQNLLSSSLNYSSIDHELEQGVWYAWQVVMFYNGVQVQQSEVWKFIKDVPGISLSSFLPLRITNDATIFTVDGKRLNVSTKAAGEFLTKCTISDSKGKVYSASLQQVVSGEYLKSEKSVASTDTRYFSLDLDELGLKKGYYTFTWNINQTKYTLNFLKQ